MNESNAILTGSARERIVTIASDLFYKQGYRATGINEVIKKSGVAKATFYNHFPSKDDLYKACLHGLSDNELVFVDSKIRQAKTARTRFLAVIESLKPWSLDTNFRGCAFLNTASEIPDPSSPLRKVGTKLYDEIRARVEHLAKELIESDPKKYGGLNIKTLTDDYMIAFSGAVALAELYHAIWPIEQGVKTVRRLIGE